MTTQNEEYGRVLKNPQNFIISEELEDVIFQDSEAEENSNFEGKPTLKLSEKEYVCKIKKIERKKDDFKIKVQVPSLTFEDFLEGSDICLKIHHSLYAQREDHPVVYNDSRILTFTARRIIKNEEV